MCPSNSEKVAPSPAGSEAQLRSHRQRRPSRSLRRAGRRPGVKGFLWVTMTERTAHAPLRTPDRQASARDGGAGKAPRHRPDHRGGRGGAAAGAELYDAPSRSRLLPSPPARHPLVSHYRPFPGREKPVAGPEARQPSGSRQRRRLRQSERLEPLGPLDSSARLPPKLEKTSRILAACGRALSRTAKRTAPLTQPSAWGRRKPRPWAESEALREGPQPGPRGRARRPWPSARGPAPRPCA